MTRSWSKDHIAFLESSLERGLFHPEATKQMMLDVQQVATQPSWLIDSKRSASVGPFAIRAKSRHPVFLAFQLNENQSMDEVYTVDVAEVSRPLSKSKQTRPSVLRGGVTYRLFVNPDR
jgi:hypothetical protein